MDHDANRDGVPGIVPPVFVNLLVGGRCRLRCPFCRAWRNDAEEMPVQGWVNLFADLAAWVPGRPVAISGGEPLLHPGIEPILRAAADAGLLVNVSTSGEPFDDALVHAFPTWPVDGITLSLDGLAATHDRLRGKPGLFRNGLDALDYFKEVRPGLHTTTATVINGANLPELRELTEFLLAKPQIERIYFHAITYFGETRRWAAPESLPLWPEQSAVLSFLDWLDARRRESDKLVNSPRQIDLWRRYFTDPLSVFDATGPCPVGRYTLTVKSDGGASLCDFHGPIGNVRDRAVRDLWEGEPAGALRERMAACRIPCVYLVNCSFEDVHLDALPEDARLAYLRAARGKATP